MFKTLLKKLKKLLITLLCLAVAVGAVFGIRWLNQGNSATGVMAPDTTVVIPNSELTKIEGEGLYLADETDALRLYVDLATGNIEVENKQTGYIWRSCPIEEEMALDKPSYPDTPAMLPYLVDCAFTTGIVPREDGKADLYSGIGDVAEGRIVIDNPFGDLLA